MHTYIYILEYFNKLYYWLKLEGRIELGKRQKYKKVTSSPHAAV